MRRAGSTRARRSVSLPSLHLELEAPTSATHLSSKTVDAGTTTRLTQLEREAAAARESATAISNARRIGVGGKFNYAAYQHGNSFKERTFSSPCRADADLSPLDGRHANDGKPAGTRPARQLKDRDLLSPFEQL